MAFVLLEIMNLDCMAILIKIGLEVLQIERALQDVVSVWGQP
jgi:hypothetical protein